MVSFFYLPWTQKFQDQTCKKLRRGLALPPKGYMGEAPPRWPTSVVVTLLTSPIHRARLAFGLFHAILVVICLASPIHWARLAFAFSHAILVVIWLRAAASGLPGVVGAAPRALLRQDVEVHNSGIGVAATSSSSFFHASDMSQADREHTGQAKLGISDGQVEELVYASSSEENIESISKIHQTE
uniref:Uncharacterized protein n=1 Tax=Oryza punctata TaxID=4537 RepID=A0A0E0M8A9_ORYPU